MKKENVLAARRHEQAIRKVIFLRYSRKEAINILDGKNYDGTENVPLPF